MLQITTLSTGLFMEKINVKIYGIENKITNDLHQKFEEILSDGFDAKISHVEDIDEMLDSQIEGIPAISINEKVIYCAQPSKLDLVKWVFSYIASHTQPIQLKKILVPVDFSKTSINAFHFALALAEKNNASIKLIHINSTIASTDGLISDFELDQPALQSLQKLIDSNSSNVAISASSRFGFVVDEIVKCAEEDNMDMILMGTMGEHLGIEKALGTVSTDVSQIAHCPVMLIPPNISFSKINNILFASDYQATKGPALEKCLQFTKGFQSSLHFVHVDTNGHQQNGAPTQPLKKAQKSLDSDTPMYFSEVKNNSVLEGLYNYSQTNDIDLLIVISLKRPFWERIFHKSTTKRMVLNSSMPLLVLHSEK